MFMHSLTRTRSISRLSNISTDAPRVLSEIILTSVVVLPRYLLGYLLLFDVLLAD